MMTDWNAWSRWTRTWVCIITFLIVYPTTWYVYERFIKGSTLLYEPGITFVVFSILIAFSFAIWGAGVWIRARKNG